MRRIMVVAMGLALAAVPALAADIVLFNNTSYVDWIPGNPDAEASNLYDTLTYQGNNVSTFTGVTAAAINAAVAGQDILVIPETEIGDLAGALDAAAEAAIASYVQGGGALFGFLYSGDVPAVLNNVFGYSLVATSADTPILRNVTNAAGTPFMVGSDALPRNNGTDCLDGTSLPGGALAMFEDVDGDSCITVIPEGSGYVIVYGWDWYEGQPTGAQDDGWLIQLNNGVELVDVGPQVVPVPMLSRWGIVGLVLLIGIAGALLVTRRHLA